MNLVTKRKIDKYSGYLALPLLILITKLLGLVLFRSHSLQRPPKRLLLIKIMGMGSLFLGLDSIKAIKVHWPQTQIVLLTDPNIKQAMAPLNIFDEIWEIRSDNFFLLVYDSFKNIFKSWSQRNTWVVDMEVYSKLTTIFSLFTCAINRFGFYLSPVFFRRYLNTHSIHFNQFNCLEENYAKLAEAIIGPKLKHKVKAKNISTITKRTIAVNNTCSDLSIYRKLSEKQLIDICSWIMDNTDYKIVLLGGPTDINTNENFIQKNYWIRETNRIKNVAGKVDFVSYYKLLRDDCLCVITIDSAPLHIAKYFGVPTFSIWGPTDPDQYLKISCQEETHHQYIYLKAPCSPCVHHFEKPPCGGDNFCIQNIDSAKLVLALRSYFSGMGCSFKERILSV